MPETEPKFEFGMVIDEQVSLGRHFDLLSRCNSAMDTSVWFVALSMFFSSSVGLWGVFFALTFGAKPKIIICAITRIPTCVSLARCCDNHLCITGNPLCSESALPQKLPWTNWANCVVIRRNHWACMQQLPNHCVSATQHMRFSHATPTWRNCKTS